jgi:DNA primase
MTDTQAIKDRLDIVQIIGEYVRLKKAGINYKANCPFHNEKSPSFMVQPEKQFWHCFGCGKGGDVFSFLQEMEGIDFAEALKILAGRAGVQLDSYASEVNKSQKNRIIEINNKAAYFFHHFLSDMPAAQGARDYLQKRQLTPETITDWQVGFIPEQWDLLTKYLLQKGNSVDDLLASGLTIKKEGGNSFYDRFRGRIMFPIWDVHGNVVGFTGRVLVETEKSGGKYVNTPQTLVFDKSRILYGLNKAKTEIKSKDFTVLVEGQMDVIACHQMGMKNVVASSGTALTFEQVKLLKRYSNNIAIAFDADAAGQNAAKRGIDLALEQGMSIKIIQIPVGAGKDADECIKKDKGVWLKVVTEAREVMDWYFSSALLGINKNDPKQKQKASDTLLAEIFRLPYAVERDHWLKKLSYELGVEQNTLAEEMKRIQTAQPKNFSDDKQNNQVIKVEKKQEWTENTKFVLLIENFLTILLKFPSLFSQYALKLRPEFFAENQFTGLYESLKKHYNGNIDLNAVKHDLSKEEQTLVDILLLKLDKEYSGFDLKEADREAQILFDAIKSDWQKNKRQELSVKLKQAESRQNEEEVKKIIQEIMNLEK